MLIFTTRIRETRENSKLTQAEVAKKAQVSLSAYSSYEGGKTPPLDVAVRIADALGVSLEWLTGADVQRPDKCDTYGYVARKLVDVIETLKKVDNSFVDYQKTPIYGFQDSPDEFSLSFKTAPIAEFFDKYNRFSEMANDNMDAREMFKSWTSGELRKLDARPLNATRFVEDTDEDLPF